jgi:RNA polymerase sigma-B factor
VSNGRVTSSPSCPRPDLGGAPHAPRARRPGVGRRSARAGAGALARCDEGELTLAETIGCDDERFAAVERRADLSGLVDRLSPQEQAVLRLRFERDLTQSEIGDVLGVSQIHVSRILRGAIDRLRQLDARTGRQ